MNRKELKDIPTEDLEHELARRNGPKPTPKQIQKWRDWSDPVGLWTVSTEGDEEGRSTKELGLHQGHVVDIAFYLHKMAFYSLHFRKIEIKEDQKLGSIGTVHVSVEESSEVPTEIRPALLWNWLRDEQAKTPYQVEPSNYFGCVQLTPVKDNK